MEQIIRKIISLNEVQSFFYFAIFCALFSAILQWLGMPSIDHDELEAVRWGAAKSWFVDKHPPLVGFISFWWAEFTQYSNLAFFILSKINAIIALFVIFKLNRYFLSPNLSLVATAAYASTYTYITLMSQMDANGILHILWPLFALFLWKSISKSRSRDWIILGLISALTILGKYQSALLLITALLMILSLNTFRKHILSVNFALALIVFVLFLTPHLLAFFETNYSMIDRVLSRTVGEKYFNGRLSIITFIITQMLTSLFGFYILLWSVRKHVTITLLKFKDEKTLFLIFIGLILPIAPILFSLVSGMSILGSWGLTSWFLFPTFILYLFVDKHHKLSVKPYFVFLPIYLLIMFLVIVFNNFYFIARPTNIPIAMKEIETQWFAVIDDKPNTVITNSRPAQGMVFYSSSKPQVINSLYGENPIYFSWLLTKDKCTNGPTLIIVEQNHDGNEFLKRITNLVGKPKFYKLIFTEPSRHKITMTSRLDFQIAGYSKAICF